MQFTLPSYEVVLEIHDELVIAGSGGLKGLPHPEAIKSAIHRPMRYMYYDGECNIHTVCAVLIDSLARNHAFADGNKRTALMTTLYTYIINDHKLTYNWVMNQQYEELVLWVVNEKPPINQIAGRLAELAEEFKQRFIDKVKDRLDIT
jgi:death-on-curing protein